MNNEEIIWDDESKIVWDDEPTKPVVTQPVQTQAQPQEEGFFSRVGNDLKDRWNTLTSDGYLKTNPLYTEQNALRMGGQIAGAAGDVIGQGLRSAYQSLVPKKVQEGVSFLGNEIMQTPVGDAVQDVGMAWKGFKETNPEVATNVEAAANIAQFTPAKMIMPKGMKATKALASETGATINDAMALFNRTIQPVTEDAVDKQIRNTVKENLNKSIRSTARGKETLPLIEKYFADADTGIREIIKNKENLGITNVVGEVTPNVLPTTRMQMLEAAHATEKKLFQEYDAMQKAAGKKGAVLDLEPIAKELDSVINSESLRASKEGRALIKYAEDQQEILRDVKQMSPQAAQDWIANANNTLLNKNLNPSELSKAQVNSGTAGIMRKKLDELIEQEVGSGYQDIKKRYGAVKSLREGTRKAAFASFAEKNIPNFFDITSGAALVHGLIAGNIATIAGTTFMEATNQIRKRLFNPDTYVKRMFSQVDELMTKKGAFQPQSAAGKYMQGLGSEVPPSMPKSPYSFNPQAPKTPMLEYREKINPQMRGLNEQLTNNPSKAIEFDNRGVPVGDAYMPDIIDVPFSSTSTPLNSIEGRLMPRLGYSDFDVGEVNTLRRSKQRLPMDILERRSKYERY